MDTTITMIEQILGTNDINRRCAVYQNLQQHLRGSIRKIIELNDDKIRNLATIMGDDCKLEKGQITNIAWELLEYILTFRVFTGDAELIFLQTLLEDNSNEKIKLVALKTLKHCVLSAIINDKNRIVAILNNASLVKQLISIIDDVCTNLPNDMCGNCLVQTIMPLMFNVDTPESLRNEIIDLGGCIVNHVNLNNFTENEDINIINTIDKKYLQVINDELAKNDKNWSKLWIFLIKFIGIKLHTSLALTNSLLKIVERAFRSNAAVEQRIAAYGCWRELINNLSLNMDYLCSQKQIKLIIIPLKAKLSRSNEVTIERLNTFTHLFEKLQDKSVLCLKEFLDFCIGPVRDLIRIVNDDKNEITHILSSKTITIILSIIGHQHNDDEICVKDEHLTFNQPVVNTNNFKDFDSLLITASLKYSSFIFEWEYEHRFTVIKCLWKSLFNLIGNSPVDVQERCYSQINKNLVSTLKEQSKNTNSQQLLNIICEVAVNYKISHDELVETLFKTILNLACCKTANINNAMIKFVSGFDKFFNTNELEPFLLHYYLNETVLINFDLFYECWLKIIDFSVDLSWENRLKLLNWSIIHLDKFKDQTDVCVNWIKYYQKCCQSDDERCAVLQNIKKIFLNNPLLGSNVIQIVQALHSEGNIIDKETNLKFLTIIESILSFPALSQRNLQTLIAIVSTYFDKNHLVYQLNDNDSILSTLCNCIIRIVNIQKDYSILSSLQSLLESLDKDILLIFSRNLTTFVEVLLLSDDDDISTKATKLSQLLELDTNNITTDTMRISTVSDSSGNNIQKITPIINGDKDTKSSMLKKSTNDTQLTRSSRMVAKVLKEQQLKDINDESSSDFIKISSEVRLEPWKLSEHQKEILNKRRDDIPALYVDLSQSQTNDFTSNDDTINENSCISEDPHKNITVRNKNKKINVENNNSTKTTDINDITDAPISISNTTITEQINSNTDDNIGNNNNSINDQSVNVTSSSNISNGSIKIKAKKITRKSKRIEEFSSKDYRRKRKHTKNTSVRLGNNKRISDDSKQQQQLNENQKTESDKKVSHIKRRRRKHGEVLEKRQLRQRTPSLLSNKSEWFLDDFVNQQEPVEKKLLRKQILPKSNNSTWCLIDTESSVDNSGDEQQQDNNAKIVNDKDNERSTLLDFKPSTTMDQRDKIKIGKQLLNMSIDSVNKFNTTKRKHHESKRDVKSLSNLEIEDLDSEDIIESSQETSEPTILKLSPRKKQENSSTVKSENNNEGTEILTKTTQLTDTETCDSIIKSPVPQIQLELPKKEKLTEADIEISLLSTATLTPTSEQNNLASSPITCDTPDRTIELINDTSDISPINANINEDGGKKTVKYGSSSNSGGDRSRKMLQMANITPTTSLSATPKQLQMTKNRFRLGKIMSPSINIRKIKKTKQNDENLEVLTFTRNIPKSEQVPGSGILKRKTQSDEFLPNPKRKRVNFSDPATTSKKIIIKDPHEFTSDNITQELANEDVSVLNRYGEYTAMFIEQATEKGLDRCQIISLIHAHLKDNGIEINEFPTELSIKNQLKCLTNSEAADLLDDYFNTLHQKDMEEIRNRIVETNKNQKKIYEKFLLELTDPANALEISKKIHESIQKIEEVDISQDNLSKLEKTSESIQEIEIDDEVVQDKVCKWKTDKFIDLFEAYNNQLNDEDNQEERNKFLIDLMERCSNSLTDSDHIDDHFRITQNFVKKFT